MYLKKPEAAGMKNFIIESYELVMDSSKNPLRHLDLASQHYTMQVLAWMWSMVFSLSFLSIFYFHYVWLGHLLVLGGVCFTVGVFRSAENTRLQLASAQDEAVSKETYSHASACTWKLDKEA
ncbi:MAG: ABC-type protease/lipase transport system fused ATPase/permease subunit [Zhongshania aliphaticivorans]|jgi:ABC-type protease/lipase transport system fused ATPase/permease subunit